MLYLLFTTGRCNLGCTYCGGAFPEELVPAEVEYDLGDLVRPISRDPRAVVAFYGGEPLLNPGFIRAVMDRVPAEHFVIQTNGLPVERLPPEYWRRFSAVLVSVDGREEVTDRFRGKGVYRAALRGARRVRGMGFRGDLIARMALTEEGDVHADVSHLLSLSLFDHVHWQLNAVWCEPWRDLGRWLEDSYRPGLRKLRERWVGEMAQGRVLGIAPFLGVAKRMLSEAEPGAPACALPCGAGVEAVAVTRRGEVLACPIAMREEWAKLGRLGDGGAWSPVRVGEPCTSCSVYRFCGGRCLYAYREHDRYWPRREYDQICDATQSLVAEMAAAKGRIVELLEAGVIAPERLRYPEFNNTIEVIP
jgi:putative peptide-modifying radical SAM enzyme